MPWRQMVRFLVRSNLAIALAVFALVSSNRPSLGDGVLISWAPRDISGMSEKAFNDAKLLKIDEILAKNLKVTTWAEAYMLLVGASAHQDDKVLFKGLVAQLADGTEKELKGTSRLILWPRITKGEILFEGKGLQVNDDLFRVAGRANWILRQFAKKNFGYVEPTTTKEQLAALQQKWTRWLEGEEVEEHVEEFPTTEKGLSEIRSRQALEALIVSLKPSEAKEKLTLTCLKKLYDLDRMPDDPQSPARLCDPDHYAFRYLQTLTGIEGAHDHAWWAKWWKDNQKNLAWNPDSGAFEVKK